MLLNVTNRLLVMSSLQISYSRLSYCPLPFSMRRIKDGRSYPYVLAQVQWFPSPEVDSKTFLRVYVRTI